jgi:glycosyltransferase involved in cell wall biosynthesis
MLCDAFVRQGHEVRLATSTPAGDADDSARSYAVLRRPGIATFLAALRWADVHMQANISLKHAWPFVVAKRRCIYQHNNVYQRDDGTLAPTDHAKRWLALRVPGIANSRYTAGKLGCRRVVLNAYDDATFQTRTPWAARTGDLIFVGRLVSQKGCDTLVNALAHLQARRLCPRLTIVGDGPERGPLEALGAALGVAPQISFAGRLEGEALARELDAHRIFVAPSRYEEPFGIVALEALGCGCVPVVSERGGLVDAIGPHGLTFPNGDPAALADRLATLLEQGADAQASLDGVETHLAEFRADIVAERYVEVFRSVARR